MEVKNFEQQLYNTINSLEEKIKENIFLTTEKNSYLNFYLLKEQIKFQEETIESLISINYINNCLKQKRFASNLERNKFLENQTFPLKKNTYWFYNQGLKKTTSWKGKTILKTAYDLIIYQMLLWELKPKSIVEIGTGNGSSSEYLNDLNQIYKNDCEIFTFDINNKNTFTDNINYFHIDLNEDQSFDKYLNIFQNLKKPTLIIEDAHVNVGYVLKYLSKFLITGDYFIVEDSFSETDLFINKYPIIQDLCEKENFLIDTKYTDYFGINMTSSKNSILRKN